MACYSQNIFFQLSVERSPCCLNNPEMLDFPSKCLLSPLSVFLVKVCLTDTVNTLAL